ncbi:MAG: carbohydrate kinase family protein [Lachnospiraceae bacterium]|nr:carbohydrate kinase family protein [Lachnospiraceae bacterium]
MQDRYPQIIGVGHCCQDSICTIEEYPPEDGSTHITAIDDSQGGGAVATAMVAAAKLGVPTGMIAQLGDDATGDQIVQDFCEYGMDVTGIRRVAGGRSSSSIVLVDPQKGTRTKFPYRDNLPVIPWEEQQQDLLRHAKVLHLDGTQYDNAVAAAARAKEYGVIVSLDGCSMQKDHAKNRRLAAMADILIMNARYPKKVSGQEDIVQAMLDMAALGSQIVISTAGKDGCYAVIDGRVHRFSAFSVATVDTTGAGDVFHGAFLTAWLEGQELRSCIRFASAVSALKCLKLGGRAGIPTRSEAESLLREAGPLQETILE